jgi:bis(5'-nucleosidyl)-tetraphosphatase
MTVSNKTVLSAGVIVVRKEPDGWKYLFLRAFRNWDFPKGETQPGEPALETAIRETREETGITELRFDWGEVFTATEPYRRGRKVARYYLALTTADQVVFGVNPQIGGPEHHEYRWLCGPEIERIAPARLLPVIRWARGIVEG